MTDHPEQVTPTPFVESQLMPGDSASGADAGAVAVYVQGDHAVLAGPDDAVDLLLAQFAPRTVQPIDGLQRFVDLLAGTTGLSSALAEHNGRWVQLTAQSHAWLQQFQAVPGADGSLVGVVRGAHGQFAHTLSFTTSNVDPSMLGDLHTFGATLALRLAIARLERAIDRIDTKIDALIDTQRATELGEAAGATWILDRTYAATDEATHVSDVDWGQVQHLGQLFATMTRRAIEKLKAAERKLTNDNLTERERTARELVQYELQTSLGLLALAHRNQLRWQELEIGRLQATEPDRVEPHRLAADSAAAQLRAAVQQRILEMHEALQRACRITDWDNTRHPIKARRLIDHCSAAHNLLSRFAEACTLSCPDWETKVPATWSTSATAVADASKNVAVETVRRVGPILTPAPARAARTAIETYRRRANRSEPAQEPNAGAESRTDQESGEPDIG